MSSLTCPTCGRQIPTSGAEPPTICPACGASLQSSEPVVAGDAVDASATSAVVLAGLEDASATRPVPVDQLPTRPSPSPSPAPSDGQALAAGAPGATQDLPASALPPAGGASAGGASPNRRAGRSALRSVGIVALLALLAVIVVGAALAVNGNLPFLQTAASPTATATLAAPTATATTTIYERASLYQIRYPNGWVTTEQNAPPSVYQVTIQNHHGGASVSITAQRSLAFVDASINDTNYLNGLAATTNTKAQNLSQPQAITLAGQTWTGESADVSILTPGGAQYAHAAALSVNHGGWIYTIVRLAPWPDQAGAGAAFTDADQASFQPMLATFTFLG